ncbi:uncharacterized protein ACLA_080370 [Aspergillus clavatus NRRL 1]|uniref:Uncharacterized protein n=1 Tax=Aspergillus clavatus (strain ATCC 1007 / CBS 513.65 / DSM 816 / NCTC 3887 / NRRL 1 / QM 1276 / 107) TaxID=344612 RepID=A1CSR6_ASPCL|nr:uncharacterized protein ACLA_080370 [Aspergillus clavatus NRRL 1]EAW06353.1 hypothetical protein ACLA_080370 [Aspergillus clavatus NRRL 1]
MPTFYVRRSYHPLRRAFAVSRRLLDTVPDNERPILIRALRTAGNALKYHNMLEKERAKRFDAMCPDVSLDLDKHIESVKRLFEKVNEKRSAGPDSPPIEKLPADTIHLHLNHRAYGEAARLYNITLTRHMEVYYPMWLGAKDAVDRVVEDCEMEPAAKREWLDQWKIFVAEVMDHLTPLEDLLFPLWEDSVGVLRDAITEHVEEPEHLLNTFHISCGWSP